MNKAIAPITGVSFFTFLSLIIIIAAINKSNQTYDANLLTSLNSSIIFPTNTPTFTPSPTNIFIPTLIFNAPTFTPTPTSILTTQTDKYQNGKYDGNIVPNGYGDVQIEVTITNSKISNVSFLAVPLDEYRSQEINSQAVPLLRQEAIKSQSANVDIISGATATSEAFIESLNNALTKAH